MIQDEAHSQFAPVNVLTPHCVVRETQNWESIVKYNLLVIEKGTYNVNKSCFLFLYGDRLEASIALFL